MSKFAKLSVALCLALVVGSGGRADDKKPEMPMGKPAAEHAFFKNFVGEWDTEMESFMEPGKGTKHKGTMTGKMIGDFWACVTVNGDMDGMIYTGQGTFGFDAKKKRATGTWVDSTGDYLWTYDGKIDGKKLVLDAKGPSPMDPTKMIQFRDTWDFSTADKMVLTSEVAGPDGKMTKMMQATCTQRK
ncbi:MAG: DUF1579 domain-containing protein [Gemmataceae bacterium]